MAYQMIATGPSIMPLCRLYQSGSLKYAGGSNVPFGVFDFVNRLVIYFLYRDSPGACRCTTAQGQQSATDNSIDIFLPA